METAEKFYSLLFGQTAISESDARWAAELCAKYPYCHAAHLLRARGVGTSQAPSANRSQLLFQIAAQVPSAVSVYRATHGSLLPLTIESDDLLYSDRESEAWQTQETSAVSGTPFSTESTQYQRHEPLSDGGSYSTSTVAYSNPQETVATQESASSTPREEAELKLDTQALDTPNAQDQAHDPSFAAFYSQAGNGVREHAESAANGAAIAGNATQSAASFPSTAQPSPAGETTTSQSADSVPPFAASRLTSQGVEPQAANLGGSSEQAHDPSFAAFYSEAGSDGQGRAESAENGAVIAENAPTAAVSFPSSAQPSPASELPASRSADSVPPPPAPSLTSQGVEPQAANTGDGSELAHDPSFAAFYSQAGSGVQEQAESAANDGKNGVVEPGLANADTPPAAARGTGGGDSSVADGAEPTTVVMDWNALLGGSTRGKGGRPKEVDTQTHGQGSEESAPVGATGAEVGEVDLRGVLDQSLATPVPEMSASLFTLEGGAGTLSAEGYEYVRTQLNPLYRKAKQEGKDQMQRIESYLNNLDSLLETMREMAKKPADSTEQQEDLARESSVLSRSIVSEHLADMHAEKGDFAIAITMYNRLAARNPEKSAYFAGKIEALRER